MKSTLKIAIVEDSPIDQEILSSFIKEFLFEKDIDSIIDIYPDGKSILTTEEKYELIFLDMYLPDDIGVEVLKKLKDKGVDSQVVFSTSSKDFVEQSYEVDALHYVVKPVTKEKISSVLNKYLSHCAEHQTISLKIGRNKENFLISNIVYIESFSHKCIVHTLNNEIEISEAISDMEPKVASFDFVKDNRQYEIYSRSNFYRCHLIE